MDLQHHVGGDDGDDVRDSDFDALEQEVATAVQLVQMSNGLPQNNQVAVAASSRLRRKSALFDAWYSLRQARHVGLVFTVDGTRMMAMTSALLPMHAVVGRLLLKSALELSQNEDTEAQPKSPPRYLRELLNIWLSKNEFLQLCPSLEARLYEASDKLRRAHENAVVNGNARKALQYSLRQSMAPLNEALLTRSAAIGTYGAAELEAGVRRARSEAARETMLQQAAVGQRGMYAS